MLSLAVATAAPDSRTGRDYSPQGIDELKNFDTSLAEQYAETMHWLANESNQEQFHTLRPFMKPIRLLLRESKQTRVITQCFSALMCLSDGIPVVVQAFEEEKIVLLLTQYLTHPLRSLRVSAARALAEISYAPFAEEEFKMLRFPLQWLSGAIFDPEQPVTLREHALTVLINHADGGDAELIAPFFHKWNTLPQIDQQLFEAMEKQLRYVFDQERGAAKKQKQLQLQDAMYLEHLADAVARSIREEQIPSLESLPDAPLYCGMADLLLTLVSVADEELLEQALVKDNVYPLLFRAMKMFPETNRVRLMALKAIENALEQFRGGAVRLCGLEDDGNTFDASDYWRIIHSLSRKWPGDLPTATAAAASGSGEKDEDGEFIITDEQLYAQAYCLCYRAQLLGLI